MKSRFWFIGFSIPFRDRDGKGRGPIAGLAFNKNLEAEIENREHSFYSAILET
jgi:hypothetical protein